MSGKKLNLETALEGVVVANAKFVNANAKLSRVLRREFEKRGFYTLPNRYMYKKNSSAYEFKYGDGFFTLHRHGIGNQSREVEIRIKEGSPKNNCQVKIKLVYSGHKTLTKNLPLFPTSNLFNVSEIFDLLADYLVAKNVPEEYKGNRASFGVLSNEIMRLVQELGTGLMNEENPSQE